ncbi:hypothetical protein KWO_005575 [Xanthomonas vasicola pv. musacearum NCPPB 4379]|nr:hypothetical protein KWO_005575 [Xanthomonas vasicola pv. musacearum NCPPB 4379]RRJ38449.1 hypothetical protein EIM46_15090 [Xanthomonas vasicola pv. musacearum]RRJ69743.1 hypothetical protein EIM45_06450 [Xanthomonas vasicola pv. musacearum]
MAQINLWSDRQTDQFLVRSSVIPEILLCATTARVIACAVAVALRALRNLQAVRSNHVTSSSRKAISASI